MIVTVLTCVGKKIAIKFARKALAHYVVSPVIHSQHVRTFLRIVYEHFQNHQIGTRVINMVSPLSQIHNRLVARGADLPQSSLLIRENYISNRGAFNGESGHQILRIFRPYTVRFPRVVAPVENPLIQGVVRPFLWSGASIGNPMSSSGELYNSMAGTLTLSNRQRALATVVHWIASSRGPRGFDASSVIEELHRLRGRSLQGYVRRISRRFNIDLTPIETYDLYLQALTGVPVNPHLQILPLPGYRNRRDRFYRSLMERHTLSRESVIERITARHTRFIPDGVVTGTRNAVARGTGAVENPEVVTRFGSICNGIMNIRRATLRYASEGFRYLGEADIAAMGTML